MRIVIVGSGALGCRFGAAFIDAGMEVWLYDIWEEHINAIKDSGLFIYDGYGGRRVLRLRATTNIKKVPRPDILIIATKAMYTYAAVMTALSIIDTNTVILTLQSGLGNIEAIRLAAPDNPVIAGVTNYASDLINPGEVILKGSGITRLMALSAHGEEMAEKLVSMLRETGHNVDFSQDIMVDIWEKVAFNSAINTVTALTGLTVGAAGSMPQSRALLFSIASEVVSVAQKEGVAADYDNVRQTIESVFDPLMSGDHLTSMLRDRITRRPTEIGALCGQVIEIAKKHSVSVPYNQAVYTLIRMLEDNYDNDDAVVYL